MMKRKNEKEKEAGGERETRRERERFAEISLFLLASTVISAKLKLPKEVSFASLSTHPLTLSHPNSSFSYLSRTPLWFGVLLTLGTSLPPANQPTKPRASLMLLLQISGRLLGCLRALLVDAFFRPRPVFLSSFFNPLFLHPILRSTPLSVVSPMLMSYLPSIPPRPRLHFILRHAPLLSFSFPEDTHSFVTIVGNGEEVDESMASASSWLVLIWL